MDCWWQVEVAQASEANPGIPPSSLMAWLRANSSIAGAVITEYDSAFSNTDVDTLRDNAEHLWEAGIAHAAVIVARALATLALGPAAPVLQVSTQQGLTFIGSRSGFSQLSWTAMTYACFHGCFTQLVIHTVCKHVCMIQFQSCRLCAWLRLHSLQQQQHPLQLWLHAPGR